MGLREGEFAAMLREIVQFLECLKEAKLPASLENIRNNLLLRSKETLTQFVTNNRPTSPEAYLNMKGGPKGLIFAPTESEVQEYIGADEPRVPKHQDYYESFQEIGSTTPSISSTDDSRREKESGTGGSLVEIYASLSAAQTKAKCHKCGPLYKKEGKKLFVFEQYRACWIGLVGSHLLIYGSDRDNRPCAIQPIRGYMARPAPAAIPRDQRRSECAFEIFRPGSRTLQFIARTPKDMEQWVAKIIQMSGDEEGQGNVSEPSVSSEIDVSVTDAQANLSVDNEEQYQDVGSLINNKNRFEEASLIPATAFEGVAESGPSKSAISEKDNLAPPLPARIPRRLPSLPPTESVSSYEHQEDEEDDIYHKIEDFRDLSHYQNVTKNGSKAHKNGKHKESMTYDDIRATVKEKMVPEENVKGSRNHKRSWRKSRDSDMTYDDTGNVLKTNKSAVDYDEQEEHSSYDDIENLIPNTRLAKGQASEKKTEPIKTPQKKPSFLDRVRSRKESPRKTDKQPKRKTPTPPPTQPSPANADELSMYDDVSGLISNPEQNKSMENEEEDEELPEYNCPPPPRPIYTKPPVAPVASSSAESIDFYDDVGCLRGMKTDEEKMARMDQALPGVLSIQNTGYPEMEEVLNENCGERSFEDTEHYKTPKKELSNRLRADQQEEEELYDDIAILAEFTARQRESFGRKDAEESKFPPSSDRKPWNRFGGGRKPRTNEPSNPETNSRSCNGNEDNDEFNEQQSVIRMNTFQKLISKMENSLGKATRNPTMGPLSRSNGND